MTKSVSESVLRADSGMSVLLPLNDFPKSVYAQCITNLRGSFYYLPWETVEGASLSRSSTRTECPWKGTAFCYNAHIAGRVIPDAVWYYPNPEPSYEHIAASVAFGKPIRVFPQSSHLSRQSVAGVADPAASATTPPEVSAQNDDLPYFLLELPTTEVHLHFEAMIDVPSPRDLIQEHGTTADTVRSRQELFERFQVRTLDEFISLFIGVIQPNIRRESDLEQFVYGARDYVTRNSIEYAEIFVVPTNLLARGMSCERSAETIDSSAEKIREAALRTFYDAGIPVFLNTDDPVIFGVESVDEFFEARCRALVQHA